MKKLYRSATDKMVGGVCGGIAEYFDVDASLVRLLTLAILLLSGGGLLVYIAAWIIVPKKPIILEDYCDCKKEEVKSEAEEVK